MPDSAEENVACRICMDSKDNYVYLLSHDLSKKLMEISDVQVEKDDGLPDVICTECESDLEKCYEFRIKVQVADKKFRENIRFSQVDIEEYNIKEERDMDDGSSENIDDRDSVSMDEEHCNDEPEVLKNREETEEAKPDPLNHVVVVEGKRRKIEMSEDPLIQDEAMIEEPQVKTSEEPAPDPLFQVCKKEESEADIMDVEGSQTDPFGPSSSVKWTGTPQSFSVLLSTLSQGEKNITQDFHKERSGQPPLSEIISAQDQMGRIQKPKSGFIVNTQSGISSITASESIIPSTTPITIMYTPLPDHVSSLSNIPTILTSKIKANFSGDTWQKNLQKSEKKQSMKIERKITKKTVAKSVHVHSGKLPVCTFPPSEPETVEEKEENEFVCSVCNVDCGTIHLLQEHKSGTDFICRACTTSFANHSELEAHFISHKKYTCEFCKKVFYIKKDLLYHKNTVSLCNKKRTRIQCNYCHRTFLHRRNLNQHLKLDHNANAEDNVCLICKTSFKNRTILRFHLKSVHSVYEGMECEICHKILLGPERLKHHIKVNHIETTESCPICEKVLSSKALKSHMEIHDEKETVCNLCGAVVKNKNALKRHLKIHTKIQENKTFACNLCNETFNSLHEKIRHKRGKHKTTPQPVFCDICGKKYKSLEVLKDHLVTHSDDKPFVCDVCGAAFKTKTVLRTHNRVHSDVRKYTCAHCGQGFRWKQTFDKHVAKCESPKDTGNNSGTESE